LFTTVILVMVVVVRTIVTFRSTGTIARLMCGSTKARSATKLKPAGAISTSRRVMACSRRKPTRGGRGAQPTYPPPVRQVTQAGAQTVPGTHTHP
jgi:hypothetical protein